MRSGTEKRPEDRSPGLSSDELLVRLAGIEPTTPWFVAKYSIQLSYSRDERNYNSCCSIRKVVLTHVSGKPAWQGFLTAAVVFHTLLAAG